MTGTASAIDRGKKNVLGVLVDAVDYESAVARVVEGARDGRGMAVSALAVHGVMTGVQDDQHRHRLNRFDLVVPDGQPVRWALNLLHGAGLRDRVYGPTLTLKLCEAAANAGLPIYLYGSRDVVLKELAGNLVRRYPKLRIAGMEPSKFRQISGAEKEEVVQRIRASGAAITFVGLGCPRQEVWAYEYREALSMPIIAVGAAFDFHAGLLPQAPPSMQRLGLEWLFRLWQEPKRLWRRYLYLNPAYAGLVTAQALRLRRFDPRAVAAPSRELSYG